MGSRTHEHRFFAGLALSFLVVTLAGFGRTYLLVPFLGLPLGALPPSPLIHAHGATALAWCLLFAVQPLLVWQGRVDLHRRIGLAGVVTYAALVVLGPFVAVESTVRFGATRDDLAFLAVSVANILAYTTLFGAALYYRRRPDLHKRLMVLGMVGMATAAFGRLVELPMLLSHVAGPAVFVVALAAWDVWSRKRLHPVTLLGGPAILVWEFSPNLYMHSSWWLATAQWLVDRFPFGNA